MFRSISRSALAFVFALFFTQYSAFAQPDGKALFMSNCASCHNPIKDATGPKLQGVSQHPHGMEWVRKWVRNPQAMINSGDAHAKELVAQWKVVMTAFPNLSDEEIDAIMQYADDFKAPGAPAPGAEGAGAAQPAEDNTWLYTTITLSLLIIMLILWRVNSGLRRVAAEKEGLPVEKEIPVYRNKTFIAIFIILIFIAAGYWMVNGAVNLGRQQNYMPEQPVFYSHKVHAGINQINCLYCHAGAEKSRHAMIPSPNMCMNCHKQIDTYTGADQEPLVDAEGNKIDGTKEIQKLYKYAGWDPVKKEYIRDAQGNIASRPIEWVKVHNLPDHVYFNHAQHVNVGKVPCQRCHGPVQDMHEMYQFSSLSMGWCINCHRQTEVQFADNQYYSIFERYHQEIKEKKRTGVTVADIGGLECQKCHY